MLFFLKAQLRNLPNIPREQWLGMVVATWELIKQLENNGKVLAGGAMIGRNAGCVIANVDSNEELSDLLNRLPVYAYLEWDVAPMIPAQSALDAAKWALQHGAAAPAR